MLALLLRSTIITKILWKADRGRITPNNVKLPTGFELGIKQSICYKMNMENNNKSFPVTAGDRESEIKQTHPHKHKQMLPLHNTHLYAQINTGMPPFQFILIPLKCLHGITIIQPTKYRCPANTSKRPGVQLLGRSVF